MRVYGLSLWKLVDGLEGCADADAEALDVLTPEHNAKVAEDESVWHWLPIQRDRSSSYPIQRLIF